MEENIFDVNFSNNTQSEIDKLVEKRLADKQANKLFKDSENRVRGAKKEKRAYQLVSLKDLDNIEEDEVFARSEIVKDKVYPKVDIEKEREQGVSSGAAYLKKELRKSIISEPKNNKLYRKIYVGYINILVTQMENIYSMYDFKQWTKNNYPEKCLMNLVGILNPELAEQNNSILELKEAEIAQKENEQQVWQQMKSALDEKLKMDYPDAVEIRTYGISLKDNLPAQELEKYKKLEDEILTLSVSIYALKKNKLDHIRKWWENSELKETNVFSSNRIRILFVEIFGKAFDNFLMMLGDASQTKYLNAESYESLSESESLEIMNSSGIVREKKIITAYENDIETAKTLVYREEFDNFYKSKDENGYSRDRWRFHYSFFPNTSKSSGHLDYKDCKSMSDLEVYNKRWIAAMLGSLMTKKELYAKIEERYKVREDNWEWAIAKKKGAKKETDDTIVDYKLKANSYPPLAHLKRTGGIKITEEDITVESIEKKFGFRTVQFGISLKDSEAKEHIRHFISAAADFSEILNFDLNFLNKLGGLSIAFAARGGGKASAHYEGDKKIINITKTRGGGALAHEYLHYLDNIIPKIDNDEYDYEDYASNLQSNRWGTTLWNRKIKNGDVENAIINIFRYIYDRKLPNGDIKDGGEIKIYINANDIDFPDLPKTFRNYNSSESVEPTDIDEYLTLFRKRYSSFTNIEDLKKKEWNMLGAIVKRFGHKQHLMTFKTNKSAYYANSIGMSSDYWSRAEELFARAFECYVYDKLEKVGRENNYLVSGVYFDHPLGVYPQGEERIDLYNLYDAFTKSIKEAYGIPDFTAWTTERVDEFIAIEDDSKGKVKAGVIVDSESGELVGTIDGTLKLPKKKKAAKKKLVKLLALLKIEIKEKGGNIDDNNNFLEKLNKFALNL